MESKSDIAAAASVSTRETEQTTDVVVVAVDVEDEE